jgi:serine/threonine protein phosphatase PrpC/serine/threonine protein kinase
MSFEIDIGYTSLTGKRSHNEDFAGAMMPASADVQRGCIAAVADGVSTGGRGREAAMTTVTTLVRDYFCVPVTWDTTVALDRLIAAQNSWLASQNRRREHEEQGDGLTTLTALVLRGQTWTLAHVGDTRAYLLRDGVLTQLSADHVRDGVNMKHVLLRALGAEERVLVDYSQGELHTGDVFILLTDGVHGSLKEKKLPLLLDNLSPQEASAAITDAALAAGSADNCTALVLHVKGLATGELQDAHRRANQLPIPRILKVGDQIDGYVVTAVVANNGINVVYQVCEPVLKRLFALKTLHELRANDAEERAMLAHEAWLAQRMNEAQSGELARRQSDAYFVWLHDTPNASAFYLLYDWLSGQTLERLLDAHKLHREFMPVADVIRAAMATLSALGLLHRQGVIHRDIKPANLHLAEDGFWRVLDLGVALSGNEPQAMRELHAGTPSYINPEQWGYMQSGEEPQNADSQSDLFALGVTIYQMLSGRLPYGDVLPYQVARYANGKRPLPPSRLRPEVPIWLDHVVLKAIALEKSQRFETAEEFLLALGRGAARPLTAPSNVPLIRRDPAALWKIGLAVSILVNALLIYWLLFLPR